MSLGSSFIFRVIDVCDTTGGVGALGIVEQGEVAVGDQLLLVNKHGSFTVICTGIGIGYGPPPDGPLTLGLRLQGIVTSQLQPGDRIQSQAG